LFSLVVADPDDIFYDNRTEFWSKLKNKMEWRIILLCHAELLTRTILNIAVVSLASAQLFLESVRGHR